MANGSDIKKVIYRIFLADELLDNEAFQLVGLSVSNRINKIPRARLELSYSSVKNKKEQSETVALEPAENLQQTAPKKQITFLPGTAIRIELGYKNELQEVFSGYITKQSIKANLASSYTLAIDCKHAANQMTLNKRTRFLHQEEVSNSATDSNGVDTVNDIDALSFILDKYNLKLGDKPVNIQDVLHENLVQYNCSDWDFLIMRLEQLGLLAQVDGDEIKLIAPELGDSEKEAIVLGENLMSFEANYDETKIAPNVAISKGEVLDEKAVTASVSSNIANPDASHIQTDLIFNHGGDLEESEMENWAANKMARQELAKVMGVAKILGANSYALADTTKIEGFGGIWSEKVFVSGIKHTLREGEWMTYLQCGLSECTHAQEYELTATASEGLLPSTNGLLFGEVKAYKKGRDGNELVEVLIPSFDELDEGGNAPEGQLIYARLASFMAGENRGAIFRPTTGDEVVVGFINNDPRFPIILGALFNKNNEPKIELNDSYEQEEVGFVIDDWKITVNEKDKELTISSPNDQQITIKDNEEIILAFDGDNSIEITKEGVVINAQKIALNATTDIEIQGNKIAAKADLDLTLEGTQFKAKGTATGKIEAPIVQVN